MRRPRLLWRLLLLLLLRVEVAAAAAPWHRPVDRPLPGRRGRVAVGRGLLRQGVVSSGGTRVSVRAARRGRSTGNRDGKG